MREEFQKMSLDQKTSYLVDNIRNLPDELAEEGVETLIKAGETEYAVVLARDKGMIEKAIQILIDAGDYLWAAQIAKNAGRTDEAQRFYQEGLGYYIAMEMYGRAVSAATALKLPPEEIDVLFRRGIEVESRDMNLACTRALLDCTKESLEIALIGREDELSHQVLRVLRAEKEKNEESDKKE